MSCKHGNWPPCDECDADDVLYMRIQNLENECADWAKGYGLLFKQNGQLRDLIELMFSSTMPYDKSGQPTFSDAIVNLWSNLNQVDSAGPSACYDEPQPAPGAGDQVQMILKHRLMRKVEGDWLAASEFMTGEPDPSWLAKTEESPEEWRIEQGRRVSGEQIQAGLTRAFASWKKPAPAAVAELPFAIMDNELEALRRFDECVRDPDAGGHDVRKEMMKRLAEIGLVRRVAANIYEHTNFGLSVLNGDFDAAPTTQPAPADGWLHSSGMLYRLTDERRPKNRDEINVTMADGSRSLESRSRRALELLGWIRSPKTEPPTSVSLDFKQASELLELFGGEPCEITLITGDGYGGKGLYAYDADQPQEGAIYLGVPDEEAMPTPTAMDGPGDGHVVQQFRRRDCTDWHDGHADHTDGGGPYEERTLYTTPQPAPADDVLEALALSPDQFRTEGGIINQGKLRAAIRYPEKYLQPEHWMRAEPAPAAVVGPSDLQLLKFYSVTTDAELIAAQAAHIEKLQAKLQQPPSFAPQRVREG